MSRSKLICALLALVFTFESANADWDDDVINFVDNDVPILTKAYAENDLRKRWTDTFLAPTAQAGALQTDIVRRVQSLEFHNVGDKVDTPTAIRLLKSLDAALASLRFDQSRLEKTIFQIDSLIGACEKQSMYGSIAIQTVGALALTNVTLPFPDAPPIFIVWLDPYGISTILTALYSYYTWSEDNRKKERARWALERLPSKIISSDWALEESRKICIETRSLRVRALANYKSNLRSYSEHLYAYEASLWKLYHRIEVTLSKASFVDVLKRSGAWSVEVKRSHDMASSQLALDLEYAWNEIAKLERSARSQNGCSLAVTRIEEYEDALVELKSQIDVFILQPQLPRTNSRLAEIRSSVMERLRRLESQYKMARGKNCK